MAVMELKPEDVKAIKTDTLSTALTDKARAPNPKFFNGISKFFKDAAKAVANSDSWWAKWIKANALVQGISAGALTGGFAASLIGGPIGLVIGATVGGIAGGLGVSYAGQLLQGNDIIGELRNAGSAVRKAGEATTALLVANAIREASGVTIPQMVSGLLNFGDIIYDFNFDIPDSEIWNQITSIIDSLYGQAGQFLGSSFMRFVLTGIMSPPKVTIDVNGLALAYSEYADDKRKELLQGISNFAWVGLNAAKRIGFLFAFLQGRGAIKSAVAAMPGLKEINPDFVKTIEGWGDEENPDTKESEVQDWKISTWVEAKVDSIADPRIKSFVEGMLQGMVDVIQDDVEEYFEWRYS
jgi:hypothetical protein